MSATRSPPALEREDERIVHRFAVGVTTAHGVCDETWARARAMLGMRSVVDLVGVLGCCGLTSMTVKAFRIALREGAEDPFAA